LPKLMKEKSIEDDKTMATVVHRSLELKALESWESNFKGAEMVALLPG